MKIILVFTVFALLLVGNYNCQSPAPNLRIVLVPATQRQRTSIPLTTTPETGSTTPPLEAKFTTTPSTGEKSLTTPSPLRNLSTTQLLLLKQFYLAKYLEISDFIDANLGAH